MSEMRYDGGRGYMRQEEFLQNDQFSINNNLRIPICFCVDVSGSMSTAVSFLGSRRIELLSEVMRKLLYAMKNHPKLSEQACISVITYAEFASQKLPFLDLAKVNIEEATSFSLFGQTHFSDGLERSLQEIDSYRKRIWDSDNNTFTPMLVFMTDGEPVGDNERKLRDIYLNIHERIQRNDLIVFPIGISRQARMDLLNALLPDGNAHKMIEAEDFEQVFSVIRSIIDKESNEGIQNEGRELDKKASDQDNTLDTGYGEDLILRRIQESANWL